MGSTVAIGDMVADQQGASRGLRVVYQRRLAGTVYGCSGLRVWKWPAFIAAAISDPSHAFESGFFQTFFAQIAARNEVRNECPHGI